MTAVHTFNFLWTNNQTEWKIKASQASHKRSQISFPLRYLVTSLDWSAGRNFASIYISFSSFIHIFFFLFMCLKETIKKTKRHEVQTLSQGNCELTAAWEQGWLGEISLIELLINQNFLFLIQLLLLFSQASFAWESRQWHSFLDVNPRSIGVYCSPNTLSHSLTLILSPSYHQINHGGLWSTGHLATGNALQTSEVTILFLYERGKKKT